MRTKPNFYKNRVALNVLANTLENAVECYEAAEHHAIIGLLSSNYETDDLAIEDFKRYQSALDNAISIGLGAGNPNQSNMVARLSGALKPQHVNQVFTGIGNTRGRLGDADTYINGLVSPTGTVGFVNIGTGPISSKNDPVVVSVQGAIDLLKDMGANTIKYFPMKGLAHLDEYREVCRLCAQNDFGLEPTGGIDLDNFEILLQIALDANVKEIIPHVYSSIIDPTTNNTRVEDVKTLFGIIKKLVK